jgi:hypothetical protein
MNIKRKIIDINLVESIIIDVFEQELDDYQNGNAITYGPLLPKYSIN